MIDKEIQTENFQENESQEDDYEPEIYNENDDDKKSSESKKEL